MISPLCSRDWRPWGAVGSTSPSPTSRPSPLLCDELSPLAQRLGAVNTITPLPCGGWHGHNTDVEGFLAPLLLTTNSNWSGRRTVVLGCGGSARAVVAGLQDLNPSEITVVGRRDKTLQPFCSDLQQGRPPSSVQLQPCLDNDPSLQTKIQQADLVVNTTPIGMSSHQPDQGSGPAPRRGHLEQPQRSHRALRLDLHTSTHAMAAARGSVGLPHL
jgi:shikimate dehydrogenase